MKHFIKSLGMFMVTAALISSCTSAYQTAGTPDDVYASAEKPGDEHNVAKNDKRPTYRNYSDEDYDNFEDYDDRYLRMKVKNRSRWSDLDDWYYYGDRYNFSYYNNWSYWNDPFYWNNPWSPVSYWGAYSPWGWRSSYYPWYTGGYWGSGFYSPWYNNYWGLYSPYYGYGWNGFYDPWYTGWGYGYYPGWGIGTSRNANYGARGVNANTYDRGNVLRSSSTGGRGGIATSSGVPIRNTYGVRNNASVETSTGNSGRDARMDILRNRTNSSANNSRSNVDYSTPMRNTNSTFESRSSSNNSSVGSSSGSSGSSSSGAGRGGSSSGSRRF